MGLIDLGLTPVPFYEGIWDQRLEFLKEFPKGKTIAHFAQTNMKLAKEVLGGHTCIMGDVPSSILQVDTVEQQLRITCRKGGIDPVTDQYRLFRFQVERHHEGSVGE